MGQTKSKIKRKLRKSRKAGDATDSAEESSAGTNHVSHSDVPTGTESTRGAKIGQQSEVVVPDDRNVATLSDDKVNESANEVSADMVQVDVAVTHKDKDQARSVASSEDGLSASSPTSDNSTTKVSVTTETVNASTVLVDLNLQPPQSAEAASMTKRAELETGAGAVSPAKRVVVTVTAQAASKSDEDDEDEDLIGPTSSGRLSAEDLDVTDWLQETDSESEETDSQSASTDTQEEELTPYLEANRAFFNVLRQVHIFANLSQNQQEQVLKALQPASFKAGEVIVQQGERGDRFYLLTDGEAVVLKRVPGEKQDRMVTHLHAGHYFGELALIYDDPRTATVKAVTDVHCVFLTAADFANAGQVHLSLIMKQVPLLSHVTGRDQDRILRCLRPAQFADGEYIVRQNEEGDRFYIITRGEAVITETNPDGTERELTRVYEGHTFGELALLFDEPRVANVRAVGAVRCMYLTKADFMQALSSETFKKFISRATAKLQRTREMRSRLSKERRQEAKEPTPKPMREHRSSPPPKPKETSKLIKQTLANGARVVNKYVIEQCLGKGSFARVYLARCDGEHYAIKVLNKSFKQQLVGRDINVEAELYREIAIMKKLHHPNVVRLFEVIDDPSSEKIYLVMEYCEKGALMRGTMKQEPLDLEVARNSFRDVLRGLRYLHFQHVIHQDIKPENILVSSKDEVAKLSDLGAAAAILTNDQVLTEVRGTPAFMAPELLDPNASYNGPAVDIWALGATLYMMTFGEPPWIARNPVELAARIQQEELQFKEDGPVDPHLRNLLARMLTKDVDRRIKLEEVIEHEWVTLEGTMPLGVEDLANSVELTVSSSERAAAIHEIPKEIAPRFQGSLMTAQQALMTSNIMQTAPPAAGQAPGDSALAAASRESEDGGRLAPGEPMPAQKAVGLEAGGAVAERVGKAGGSATSQDEEEEEVEEEGVKGERGEEARSASARQASRRASELAASRLVSGSASALPAVAASTHASSSAGQDPSTAQEAVAALAKGGEGGGAVSLTVSAGGPGLTVAAGAAITTAAVAPGKGREGYEQSRFTHTESMDHRMLIGRWRTQQRQNLRQFFDLSDRDAEVLLTHGPKFAIDPSLHRVVQVTISGEDEEQANHKAGATGKDMPSPYSAAQQSSHLDGESEKSLLSGEGKASGALRDSDSDFEKLVAAGGASPSDMDVEHRPLTRKQDFVMVTSEILKDSSGEVQRRGVLVQPLKGSRSLMSVGSDSRVSKASTENGASTENDSDGDGTYGIPVTVDHEDGSSDSDYEDVEVVEKDDELAELFAETVVPEDEDLRPLNEAEHRRQSSFCAPVSVRMKGNEVICAAAAAAKGEREFMEDRHVCISDLNALVNLHPSTADVGSLSFFAVYDGHNGPDIAQRLHEKLHFCVAEALREEATEMHAKGKSLEPGNIIACIEKACAVMEEQTLEEERRRAEAQSSCSGRCLGKQLHFAGSTATVLLLRCREVDRAGSGEEEAEIDEHNARKGGAELSVEMFVANVGDSRAVMFTANTVTPLTVDHRPTQVVEKARIEKLGGWVHNGRLNGVLALSRSFGDFVHKHGNQNILIANPDVTNRPWNPSDGMIVLATDGLWDVMDNEQAFNCAMRKMHQYEDLQLAANSLVDKVVNKMDAYAGEKDECAS